jgi:hypothetical protein
MAPERGAQPIGAVAKTRDPATAVWVAVAVAVATNYADVTGCADQVTELPIRVSSHRQPRRRSGRRSHGRLREYPMSKYCTTMSPRPSIARASSAFQAVGRVVRRAEAAGSRIEDRPG